MRYKHLKGAPWHLDLKLAELVLRAILPRWEGVHFARRESPGGDRLVGSVVVEDRERKRRGVRREQASRDRARGMRRK